jgi:hypothetical protein
MNVRVSKDSLVFLSGRHTASSRGERGPAIDVIRKRRALLREVNEQIRRSNGSLPGDPASYILLCECERGDCLQRLEVPADLYTEVRNDGDRFLVRAGHEDDDVERVVASDGYSVVRVRPAARGVRAPSPPAVVWP